MQQTQKYKLNLIESSDPFLPEGLNQNTQKIEDVLVERMEGSLDIFDAKLTGIAKNLGATGHNARLVFGHHQGNGKYGPSSPTVLTFDFCPVLVVADNGDGEGESYSGPAVMIRGVTVTSGNFITWQDKGVKWYSSNAYQQMSYGFTYVAIGYDPAE